MVTESHAPPRLTLLPIPLSARDVPQPTDAAMVWVIDESGQLFSVDRSGADERRELPDDLRALETSYGADGTLWVLASGGNAADPVIVREGPAGDLDIRPAPMPVSKISAGPDGTLWMVSTAGEVVSMAADTTIHRHSPQSVATAEEISVGPDGSVWIIGATIRYAGRIVSRLTQPTGDWFDLPAPASATKLGVAPDGMAWTINSRGEVWRLHPYGGGSLAECQVDTACSECRFSVSQHVMSEIAVSPDGTVWVIGTTGDGAPELMWLTDPAQRRYTTIQTRLRPVRVAGGLR
ncbi:MAG: hypothetical protein L0Y54_24285 [Sporichthyaceae bacterium]|nr:hypothetical protein [Sporichthyaceae bacterium]